ncbi:putative cytochrome P450 313a4 [Haematobia irritans]|uniref:putative cytochrome P450 313a4 n=1 Tax=Haematobia irritans TaxID=7368 RepID=UPI003F508819
MSLLLSSFLVGLIFMWIYGRWRNRRSIALCRHFPVNKFHMSLGFGPIIRAKEVVSEFTRLTETHGKNVLFYTGPCLFLLSSDPVIIKEILTSRLCIDKLDVIYDGLTYTIGNGLITQNGEEWVRERRVMNGAFKISNLQDFLPIVNSRVKSCIFDYIDGDIETGVDIPLVLYIRTLTLTISFATITGRDMAATETDVKELSAAVARCEKYIAEIAFNFIYEIKSIRTFAARYKYKEEKEVLDLGINVMRESISKFSQLRGTDPSYLEHVEPVMDVVYRAIQRNKYRKENSANGLFHIFIGAFETSSMSIFFILTLLSIHPEIQQKVYEEICDIFPDDDDGEFYVHYEDLSRLRYLEMVMNETLRLLPVIPQVGRRVKGGDLILSNGAVLPEGQRIMIDIYDLHRSKEIWGPDADKFNPDNFLPEKIKSRHPYAFIPFTKGVRSCIGMRYADMSVKVLLAKLIKRYTFSTTAKLEDLVCENNISTCLTKEPQLEIKRRKYSKLAP